MDLTAPGRLGQRGPLPLVKHARCLWKHARCRWPCCRPPEHCFGFGGVLPVLPRCCCPQRRPPPHFPPRRPPTPPPPRRPPPPPPKTRPPRRPPKRRPPTLHPPRPPPSRPAHPKTYAQACCLRRAPYRARVALRASRVAAAWAIAPSWAPRWAHSRTRPADHTRALSVEDDPTRRRRGRRSNAQSATRLLLSGTHLMRKAIRGHQRQSEVIKRSSEVIRGHQRSSSRTHSVAMVIRGHQRQSEVIKRDALGSHGGRWTLPSGSRVVASAFDSSSYLMKEAIKATDEGGHQGN